MGKKYEKHKKPLRQRAEEVIAKTPDAVRKIVTEDLQSLIEELHIHQIELELQNEELRRAQLELEEARDEFSDLYDFAPIGYFTIDEKRMIQKANLTGAGMLGRERGRLLGKQFSSFICKNQKDQDNYYLHRRQVLESDSKKTCELKFVRKDGTLFDARLESMVAMDKQGEVRHLRIAVTDITETRQAQKDREEALEQLRQVQKMETIGQLAGGVAHDFNNQLQAIMGYADLLCQRLEDEKNRGYAEMIVRASQRSSNLTEQLLAFARKGKNLCVPVDIHKIIFEVSSMLSQTIDRKIAVKHTLHAHPSVVKGDPTQLQNALLNLGINARDSMPQGGEILFTTDIISLDDSYCRKIAGSELSPGQYIQICITDNGLGIDEKIRQRIFEPFFTTKEQGKGTGMGLAAVYGIVKNHFGNIDAESGEGHGATFKIYLPLVETYVDGDESALSSPIIQGTARILLVDDEELVRDIAIDMLRSFGYKVAVCEDGFEAVDYYKKHWREIDLVILDMIMPKMGGRKAFIAMKEINPGIKALLSTGYSLEGEAQAIIDEGVRGFIQKPYNLRELSKIVVSCLRGIEA